MLLGPALRFTGHSRRSSWSGKTAGGLLVRVALVQAALLAAAGSAWAAPCPAGNKVVQLFPSTGTAVSRWALCWNIERMPDATGAPFRSETLVITQARFRPGPLASHVTVVGDMRMAEIFVPYHQGTPRFHDLTDFTFNLVALTAVECPGTRLANDRLCLEVKDRGLAWREPFARLARRGETLVLWGILNAGNYDYVMQYEFDDDGAITVRAAATGQKLGGIDSTPGHFHNFAWRVNLDIDGAAGDTVHVTEAAPGPLTTAEVETTVEVERGVRWRSGRFTHLEVEDATRVNGRGRPLGYSLAPLREGVAAFGEPWTGFPIWVTRNSSPSTQLRARDLPTYDDDEPVTEEDVVLWYIESHNHQSHMRDEDRNAVPLAWVGFRLEPQNLWDATPFYP